MDRVGVFGGTFDPPHYGHLLVAETAADQLGLDVVVFVPAGDAYHKQGVTESAHRLAMTRLAVDGNPRFVVSDVDVRRDGATYTIDTLTALHGRYPEADLVFITGSDVLPELPSWRNIEGCLAIAEFAVAVRTPGTMPHPPPGINAERLRVFTMVAAGGSSTSIRAAVRAGRTVRYATPDPVVDYIDTNMLYRDEVTASASPW